MTNTEKINPEDFLSIVSSVNVLQWGNELQIHCVVDAVNRQRWILHFKNCHEIHWYINEPESIQDEEAALISFAFGKDNHQEPAMIGTDIFDVSVLYGTFELYKKQSDLMVKTYS